jgi:hypothetical protein
MRRIALSAAYASLFVVTFWAVRTLSRGSPSTTGSDVSPPLQPSSSGAAGERTTQTRAAASAVAALGAARQIKRVEVQPVTLPELADLEQAMLESGAAHSMRRAIMQALSARMAAAPPCRPAAEAADTVVHIRFRVKQSRLDRLVVGEPRVQLDRGTPLDDVLKACVLGKLREDIDVLAGAQDDFMPGFTGDTIIPVHRAFG